MFSVSEPISRLDRIFDSVNISPSRRSAYELGTLIGRITRYHVINVLSQRGVELED